MLAVEVASPGAQGKGISPGEEVKQGFLFNMVSGYGRDFSIIHGIQGAIPIEAHAADAHLAQVYNAPPLANMASHPATRELFVKHRLSFHYGVLYHHDGRGQAPTLQAGEILSTKYEMLNNIKAQNLNDQNMRVLNLEH